MLLEGMGFIIRRPSDMPLYERVTGLICIAISVAVYMAVRQYPPGDMGDPGAQLFPLLIAFCMFPLGLTMVVRPTIKVRSAESEDQEGPIRWAGVVLAGLYLIATILFVIAIGVIGFPAALFLYLFVAAGMLGGFSLKSGLKYAIFAAAGGGVISVICIRFFELTLPLSPLT